MTVDSREKRAMIYDEKKTEEKVNKNSASRWTATFSFLLRSVYDLLPTSSVNTWI